MVPRFSPGLFLSLHPVKDFDYGNNGEEGEIGLVLFPLRERVFQVDGKVSCLRGVEHHGGKRSGDREASGSCFRARCGSEADAAERGVHDRGGPRFAWKRRSGPSPGRRHREGVVGADGRGARDRQVYAVPATSLAAPGTENTLCDRRGKCETGEDACRPSGRRRCSVLPRKQASP